MDNPITLPYTTVDPKSPIPLYHQIYLDLRRIIQQEERIQPGGMLPPELEICQAYNVGRQTVRQAIARLVDENVLERFAGRGTFVRQAANLTQFFLDRSFSQQMRELGLEPTSEVLCREVGTVAEDAIPALQRWKGAPCFTLERLRLGNGEPICHQTTTALTTHCPDLADNDFSHASLYEILATRYNLAIQRIDHTVRSVAADAYRSELLEVERDIPLLFVGTRTYTEDGSLIEYTASYYRADRYEFSTSQTCCDE
jgi:GntR family transcriptional regulator